MDRSTVPLFQSEGRIDTEKIERLCNSKFILQLIPHLYYIFHHSMTYAIALDQFQTSEPHKKLEFPTHWVPLLHNYNADSQRQQLEPPHSSCLHFMDLSKEYFHEYEFMQLWAIDFALGQRRRVRKFTIVKPSMSFLDVISMLHDYCTLTHRFAYSWNNDKLHWISISNISHETSTGIVTSLSTPEKSVNLDYCEYYLYPGKERRLKTKLYLPQASTMEFLFRPLSIDPINDSVIGILSTNTVLLVLRIDLERNKRGDKLHIQNAAFIHSIARTTITQTTGLNYRVTFKCDDVILDSTYGYWLTIYEPTRPIFSTTKMINVQPSHHSCTEDTVNPNRIWSVEYAFPPIKQERNWAYHGWFFQNNQQNTIYQNCRTQMPPLPMPPQALTPQHLMPQFVRIISLNLAQRPLTWVVRDQCEYDGLYKWVTITGDDERWFVGHLDPAQDVMSISAVPMGSAKTLKQITWEILVNCWQKTYGKHPNDIFLTRAAKKQYADQLIATGLDRGKINYLFRFDECSPTEFIRSVGLPAQPPPPQH